MGRGGRRRFGFERGRLRQDARERDVHGQQSQFSSVGLARRRTVSRGRAAVFAGTSAGKRILGGRVTSIRYPATRQKRRHSFGNVFLRGGPAEGKEITHTGNPAFEVNGSAVLVVDISRQQ